MATPLFSQQPHRGGGDVPSARGSGSIPGALAEFKAGRLFRDGDTNWVRPDSRRGLCYVKKEDDGLMRFCWKERQTGAQVEEELIVLPGDVYLEKVQQATGRVYVLKFRSSSQRLFFWMQEADADGDSALIRRANTVFGGSEHGDDDDEDDDEDVGDDDMDIYHMADDGSDPRELLLNRHGSREAEALSHHREQSALARESPGLHRGTLSSAQVGGVPGNSLRGISQQDPGDDVTPLSNDASGPRDLSGLRELLSSIQVPEEYQARDSSQMNLTDVLTPRNLSAVLEDERMRTSLFPTLPEDIPHTRQALDEVIRSPQFQQALASLSYVLESGQMGPLVTQLGLDPEAGTSVRAFLQAIEKQIDKEKTGDSHSDNDEQME
ncbi:hypothetical protein GGF46_005528 [Coemansia sp. RSA 552]|nr:hypothetical protein GGF46_005528 [Coemansia sp. RSA 552]